MTKFNLEKCKSSNKGITLIALIITIIVLLILAGITIASLTGSDSAPAKANEAKQRNDIGSAKDQLAVVVQNAHLEAYDDIYVAGNETVKSTAANTTVGQRVINAALEKYGASKNMKFGDASIVVAQSAEGQDATVTITTRDFTETGKISIDGGVLTWDATPAGGYAGLNQDTLLSNNNMEELTVADIEADSSLTETQKAALTDTTTIKAVLTGNVPVPVGYGYVEGTSTAITKPEGGSYGVVIQDTNENQWVWVPVNSNESIAPEDMYEEVEDINVGKNNEEKNKEQYPKLELAKNINGLKIASINDLPSLKVASSSSSEDSEPTYQITVTTTKKGASNIISGCNRGDPNDTSSFREPALVTADYYGSYYEQAGFSSLENMAEKMVADYEAMITSITKYGGFYVGRYELSGTNNGSSSEITNAKVQAEQVPMDTANWYRLYQACRTFDTETTTSTMIWGTQWDIVCNWSQKKGDKISYSSSQSNRHSGDYNEKTGSNSNDIRNNVYDLEGSRWEWTQEAYGGLRQWQTCLSWWRLLQPL